jgi:hypothetical protein
MLCILLTAGLFQTCKTLPSVKPGPETLSLLSVLPEDGEIPQWTREGKPFLARGLDELVQQMNGGAPFYTERGVRESAFQDYVHMNDSIWINVELHRTSTPKQAKQLYSDVYAESPSLLPDLGDGGRSLPNLIGAYTVEFLKGPVYARLTITNKSEKSKAALHLFAETIAARLQQFPTPNSS